MNEFENKKPEDSDESVSENPEPNAQEHSDQPAEPNSQEHKVQPAVKMGFAAAKDKKYLVRLGALGALVATVSTLIVVFVVVPAINNDRYWETLQEQGLEDEYLTKDIAVAQGNAFCGQIESGATREAFWYQKTAVDFYCPRFSETIQIVPTEKEQNARYLDELREDDLGGEFASDAAAIAAGRAVCARLDEGGENQGPTAEAIAVKNFCPDYSGGFRELNDFKVTATFVLRDDDYLCVAGGIALSRGYDDISSRTDVFWDNEKGERLASTTLGTNTKSGRNSCTWTFVSTLPEGEQRYVLRIGRRGSQEYTEAELKVPGAVGLSLGSRF